MPQTAETPDHETARADLESFMRVHGLTIAAVFVPLSRSRNAAPGAEGKPWRSLNWRVTLVQTTPVAEVPGHTVTKVRLEADYSAGEAHAPAAKRYKRGTVAYEEGVSYEVEHGRADLEHRAMGGASIRPDPLDVFASLLRDADALDYPTFESWAPEFGYDADSRKAEAIYREALAHALALRSTLGDSDLAKARELAARL